METHLLDVIILFDPCNIYYFTNFPRGLALIIPTNHNPILFVSRLEYEEACSIVKNASVITVEKRSKLVDLLYNELTKESRPSTIGLCKASITASLYENLKSKFEGFNIKESSDLINELRSIKSHEEIELIVKALRIAEFGMKSAIEAINEGKNEIEIAGEAEYAMRKAGAEWFSFKTIVVSGYRSAYPHGSPTCKKIRENELVVIDLGAKYCGYCSDITRTVYTGNNMPPEIFEIFEVVNNAIDEAVKIAKEGIKAREIDVAARKIISEKGYGEYFVHSLGHGVGLNVHESPRLSQDSDDILRAGNVVTIEPGIYIPNLGGVRIEEMAIIEKNQCKILNELPRILK